MGNNYFQFKQFIIRQDSCAMKVSTDACIQGAWTPVANGVKRVLDIGTGTGLLSLMLAQRNSELQIDAIELDKDAALQAGENIDDSPWGDRIGVIHSNAIHYSYAHKYDLIISNPPFFNNSLLGPSANRNNARHTLSLTYNQLFSIIKDNLSDEGYASVLLPLDSYEAWQKVVQENNWFVSGRLLVYPKPDKAANRVVVLCQSIEVKSPIREDIIIRNGNNSYTQEYASLMEPYYPDR